MRLVNRIFAIAAVLHSCNYASINGGFAVSAHPLLHAAKPLAPRAGVAVAAQSVDATGADTEAQVTCPRCGQEMSGGYCSPQCDAIAAEDEREERLANSQFGVGA